MLLVNSPVIEVKFCSFENEVLYVPFSLLEVGGPNLDLAFVVGDCRFRFKVVFVFLPPSEPFLKK